MLISRILLFCVIFGTLQLCIIATPSYQGCQATIAKAFAYCDAKLDFETRVQDLLARLTIDEKIGLISPDPSLNTCNMVTRPIERLGVPPYMWLTETNTGVASTCYSPDHCSTTFPGPEGLGASFNRSSWFAKGDVLSSELRAFNNINWYRGQGPKYLIGLDGFGPNINIVRDPRFGRNSELPGEDPFLTGSYAAAYVQGMQQRDTSGYIKMLAYLKHFDAYSVEADRGHSNFAISTFDFYDTYLPAFGRAFLQGGASGLMCSYNAENGHPSCANGWLLNTVVRQQFGAPNAVVMSDCGAIGNMRGAPLNAPSDEFAAAWSINNGTDLEAGDAIWGTSMHEAIRKGLTTEAVVDAALKRVLLQLMSVGHFDDPALVSWTKIGLDVVNSAQHQQVNHEAALQSFVLLKNDEGMLPLKVGTKIAVVGPQGVAQYGLLSDYFGDEVCYKGGYDCITSIASAITAANVGGVTRVAWGVEINSQNTTGIDAAMAAVEASDVVVLVLGIDKTIEYESVDRTNITLPGLQEPFALKVLAAGKPTVLVLVNGGAVAIDNLVTGPKAIIEAFNPSLAGANALATTLFGKANRWGKLPITLYPADYITQVSITNFDMSAPPGRGYRYYTGQPLWPFGFGLSMTTFSMQCASAGPSPGLYSYKCAVSNTGLLDGDQVVMVFHKAGDDIRQRVQHPVPLKRLVAFERVTVASGSTVTVQFPLDDSVFELVNAAGDRVVYQGEHQLIFSTGDPRVGDVAFTIQL